MNKPVNWNIIKDLVCLSTLIIMLEKKPLSKVAIINCKNYEKDEVIRKIKESLDMLGGVDAFVKKGNKVLLKPNLFRTNKEGTTHPSIIYAIAKIFKNIGAELFLTDSPMTQPIERVLEYTGIKDVCDELDIKIMPINKLIRRKVKQYKRQEDFFLPSFIDEMDLIVNLPKIKSHPLTVFSGAVKNLFGLCPGITKSQFHLKFKKKYDFCHMLLDLYSAVQPGLNIMDAIEGIDRTGKTKKVGAILASRDAIALDSTACRIVRIPFDSVLTNKFGFSRNLGLTKEKDIEFLGDYNKLHSIKNFEYEINHCEVISSMSISFFDSFFLKNVFGKPLISKNCEKCGRCINICPKDAITLKNKKLKIDYALCIRCYCCQEICPNSAVLIKKPSTLFYLMISILQKIILILRSAESERKINDKNHNA